MEENKKHFWNLKVSDLTVLDTLKLKTIAVGITLAGTVLAAYIVEHAVKGTDPTDQS